MSETAAELHTGADLDRLENYENVEDDLDEESNSQSDEDFTDEENNGLHAIEDAEHHASFAVRHGFQAVDPGLSKTIAKAGVVIVVGAALWGLRRLLRRGERLSSDKAWAWTTGEQPGPQGQMDLTRPLLGYSMAVAEKCASLSSVMLWSSKESYTRFRHVCLAVNHHVSARHPKA